ncbi:homoserine dehydrogenase [Salicibibacter halophilus]|uniref:Homoserine dehydrogenase n=1 Tax=Salicibibacter halophilus TaxID=2502791 RepID=A0A514LFJ1_9BACI|nr:homoserine dehydrogenase [Salicibibacter halophilus]QDI90011.1 homoserine dehydrogenase [Salicibibacter halophilus]
MDHKVALLGFGGVGQGFLNIIHEKKEALQTQYGQSIEVVSISDLSKGTLHNDSGLDMDKVLSCLQEDGTLHHYTDEPGLEKGWDTMTTVKKSNATVVVELTPTDVETGQPAIDHCTAALSSGKHVVTTNKGPVVNAYRELQQLAARNNVGMFFEGTVMSGTPALSMPRETLAGNDIQKIRGILNGTTNSMLAEMAKGIPYESALKNAQSKGYAEADPTNDVKGYDVQGKVVILANVLMGGNVTRDDIPCQGISHLTEADITEAKRQGKTWKLIGAIEKNGKQVEGYVRPEKLDDEDPLASISGPTNAISYQCDLLGEITLTGAGAGITETGYAVLNDILTIGRS